jgi:hypothetical protein
VSLEGHAERVNKSLVAKNKSIGVKMGKIGYGYGSEWHLLRYLGYHRTDLSQRVLAEVSGDEILWLDFPFTSINKPLLDDREFIGLEFITNDTVQSRWKEFWPQTGNAQNWDAVAQVQINGQTEWLLVEAKAHVGELQSKCGATHPKSIRKIAAAMQKTSIAFGNQTQPIDYWLKPYYQYGNRLAVLYFLMRECDPPIPTRLLFIYFYGENMSGNECPQSEGEWQPTVQKMESWLGINKSGELGKRVHHLFLPVSPLATGKRERNE